MSLKEFFLSEAKTGKHVDIVVGPKEIKGTISFLDNFTVQIKNDDGKISTILIDNINCFEFEDIDSDSFTKSTNKETDQNTNETEKKELTEKNSIEFSNNSDKNKDVFDLLESRGNSFFHDVNSPIVQNYMEIAKSSNSILILNIAYDIDNIIKQSNEISLKNNKIQILIKKITKITQKSKDKHQNYFKIVAFNFLGSLYYQLKNELLSLETYKQGDDNESAFAVAESLNAKEDMELFACRHFINDKVLNSYILKWLILHIIETDDYSIISKINISKKTNNLKLVGYNAFMKAILLVNNVNYDSNYDTNYDHYYSGKTLIKSLNKLIQIFMESNIGTGSKMSEHINIPIIEEKYCIPNNNQIKKTVSECPNYMAARSAKEQEKNLDKAEQLFIEAIQNNERPSSAAADLVSLMIQKRNFTKAAEYLTRYGLKYMRKTAYRNLRSQLINKDNKLEEIISESEKSEVELDYFLLAQKSELEEKDYQKAITYYKEAISKGQKLTDCIQNLVSIYTQLEMYDEALELIEDFGIKNLEEEKYLNLRLSIFSASKDSKYKNEISDTYKRVIALSNSAEKRTDLLFSYANLMNQIGEFDTAIQLFLQCLDEVNNNVYLVPEKTKRQKINALIGLCKAYLKINDYEKALDNAKKIIILQPDNDIAKSIISGQTNDELEFSEDTTGVSKISDYILQRIEKLSLEEELKNKTSIKNGIFIGDEKEAENIINTIVYIQAKTSVNDEIKSNNYFTVAKIIHQILDRDEEKKNSNIISESKYQFYVAIGSYFYGNYRLYRTELTHNFDTARYCFLQSITIFQDAKKKHKCWAAATIRYIETFFCNTTDIKDRAKIYYLFKEYENEYQGLIRQIMQKDIVVPLEEFVVGMLEMLTFNSRVKDCVLSNISNNAMEGRILDILGDICDEKIPDNITHDQFKKVWENSSKKYYIKRNNFLRIIEETIDSVFTYGQLQENYAHFLESKFQEYLNQTDTEYVEDLRQIFASLLRYNEVSEFDYKEETLKQAYGIRKRLEEKISDNPTSFSYEKLNPMLTQLKAKIFKESSQLYGHSKPEIKVNLAGDCSIDENNLIVRVPIAFTNNNNVQNADNVSIKIEGEHVSVINDAQLSRGLFVGNGKPQEKIIKFKVNPDIIKSQVFSVNIVIHYQYKKSMTELKESSVELPLSIPLYNISIFEPIENKFEKYRNGSQVNDASMFYGRDGDIENIIKQISDESGNILRGRCLALYGQTRTGKSSLLYHLERRLRVINEERNVIINIGSIGEESLSGNDITEFLYTLLDELDHEIQSKHPKLNKILTQNNIKIDSEKLLDNPEHSQLYFNDIFKKINRCIEDGNYIYNIIVMIDEFTYIYDWIRRGIMTDRIMKFWKSFIQNNNVCAIIIGQDHMMKFVEEKQFTNDFGTTDLIKVSYLPQEDAKKLMYEPIMLTNEKGEKVNRYQAGALDRLYELTAGSAFLIMNLCAGLVEYLNKTHTVYITRAHIDEYLNLNLNSFEEARFFEPQYDDKSNVDIDEANRANKANKSILRRIAQLSNKKQWATLGSVIKTDEDKKTLESLVQRDVVIVSNGERCKIKVELYKEWLIAKYGLEVDNG